MHFDSARHIIRENLLETILGDLTGCCLLKTVNIQEQNSKETKSQMVKLPTFGINE